MRVIKKLYRKIFPEIPAYLIKELKGCESVLDLGCGKDSLLKFIPSSYKVGVDYFKPYLEESKRKKIHHKYILSDLRKLKIGKKSFDAVVALDVLEHLDKEDALSLIKKMEEWAIRKIIIYTPNGFLHQKEYDENPLQIHKSGWDVDELKMLGFKIYGMHGLKFLRGKMAGIRFKPKQFWLVISDITQKFTYHYPKLAFQLLAVKDLEKQNIKKLYQTI